MILSTISTSSEKIILFLNGLNFFITFSMMPWVTMAFSIFGLKKFATNYLACYKVMLHPHQYHTDETDY